MKKDTKRKNLKENIAVLKDNLVVDRLNAIEWIVLGVLLLLITLTLYYSDNMVMFLNYYWINEGLFRKGSVALLGNNRLPYGVVQQWFCELWILPINLIQRFWKFEIANTVTVTWFKLSMAVPMALCMSEMVKVGEILGIKKDRVKWMLILFCSTILVVLPVFHIAQSDILYAYISMVGIRAFLNDDKKKFIFFFALAISCKVLAIIVFIPLLLLREKRILYIIRDGILGISLFLVERVWYKLIDKIDMFITGRDHQLTAQKDTVVDGVTTKVTVTLDQANTDFFSHFYHKSLYFEFPAIRKGYVASFLVVLFVLLCIWCYTKHKEDTKEWNHVTVYAVSVAWLIFFINASPSPYWIVAMYPFVFLLIFMKQDCIKTNLLLINAFTLTMFLVYVMNTDWVYGGPCNLDFLIFKGLLKEGHDSVNGPSVARYLNNFGVDSVMNVVVGICFAVSLAFIVINHHKVRVDDRIGEQEEKKLFHGFTIWQICILAVWYVVNVWVVQRW